MKRCPYCAEEIQDAAVKCRWCGSDLTVAPEKVVANPPQGLMAGQAGGSEAPTAEGRMEGEPSAPAEAQGAGSPMPTPMPTMEQPVAEQEPAERAEVEHPPAAARAEPEPQRAAPEILSPPRTPSPSPNITFSHEGPRYLLGYTAEYYGIWDKDAPGPPVKRLPRTDPGWQEAWENFIRMEMGQA